MMGNTLSSCRCVNLLQLGPHLSASKRLFTHSNVFVQESMSNSKKKWTKDRLQLLIDWDRDTDGIYGPVLKTQHAGPGKKLKNSPKPKSQVELDKSVTQNTENATPVLKASKFEDTMDYKEVCEHNTSQNIKKTADETTSALPGLRTLNVVQPKLDNLKSCTQELTRYDDSGLVDKAKKTAGLMDENDRTFLSTILAFPPFNIVWDAPKGRLPLSNASEYMGNSSDSVIRGAGYPSVSAILKATMPPESKFFLELWEKEKIEELGEEGFLKFKEEMFANGTNLHICIQKYLEDQTEVDLKEANKGHWNSLIPVLHDITDVACTEKPVKHMVLRYKGILDCIANYRGRTCIIDWKTSKKPKLHIRQTYDNPVQLASYLGAYNNQPNLKSQIDNCLLVIGYEDGSPATVHQIGRSDCLKYWQVWQKRLHQYWSQYLHKSLNATAI